MKLPNAYCRILTVTLSAVLIILSGCSKKGDTVEKRLVTIFTPVYKSKVEVFSEINGNVSEPMVSTGKIYIKDNFIFLNEIDKGIHVIDNTQPAHPKQIAFLNIPGNRDISVKGNILYADLFSNLVAIDISDIHYATVTKMLSNIFPDNYGYYSGDSNLLVVSYTSKDTLITAYAYPACSACETFASADSKAFVSKPGVAGSMAKMVLVKEHLYAITERHTMGIINVSNASDPVFVTSNNAGFDLETIFPFEDKLFLGSQTGLYMFDITNPESPAPLGQFTHGRACDPVVTDGKYAYVTLRTGTNCGGESNELDVVDLSDFMNPTLFKTYQLTKPAGLSKDGDLLFVCDGSHTVNVYNAKDPGSLELVDQIQVTDPFDVIAQNNIALIIAADGMYQFDYTNPRSIKKLSFISTTAPKLPGSHK